MEGQLKAQSLKSDTHAGLQGYDMSFGAREMGILKACSRRLHPWHSPITANSCAKVTKIVALTTFSPLSDLRTVE